MNPPSDETLFAEVLARPAGERAAYLDQACASDLGPTPVLEGAQRFETSMEGSPSPRLLESGCSPGSTSEGRRARVHP
jgi:hypothetical protein